MNKKFVPVLLGSDINVYGMARCFYEAYGITSIALSETTLAPTKYSKIVTVEAHDHFSQEEVFMQIMREKIQTWKDDPRMFLLIACGDGYSTLVSKNKEELNQRFVCPYIDHDLLVQLEDKDSFYQMCEKYGLPYPKTYLIHGKTTIEEIQSAFPLKFPVVLKPADSISYLAIHFDGYKKAYIIDTAEELIQTIDKIYDHGYQADLILQDYIPGDDSYMRVLNVYVDQHHHVKMMCLGHPLLEDPTPEAVGNYVAILPEFNQVVYDQIQSFLEKINYTGFANFDMKFDERDQTYKLFEINIRQGRSSFYTTLNGYNLATYLVDDYVNQIELPVVYGNQDPANYVLWLGVPKHLFLEYASDNKSKELAKQLIHDHRYGTTLEYTKDLSPKRWVLLKYISYIYVKRFKEFFKKKL